MKLKKKAPQQDRSKFMVDSILEGAARILEGKVSGNFTTNKIAEVAGVSVGSLYQYFKNKESIVEDLLFKKLQDNLNSIFLDLKNEDKLDEESFIKSLVTTQFDLWKSRNQLSKSILRWAPRVIDPSFLHANDEKIINYLKDRIDHYGFTQFKKDNLDISLLLCVNIVRMSVYTYFVKDESYDYETYVEETIQVINNYLLVK